VIEVRFKQRHVARM